MKKIKIAITALVVTAGLASPFAFATKKFSPIDVLYNPASGQIQTAKGTPGVSIIASELKVDVNSDGVPDSWSYGSIAQQTGGPNLLGMEYQTSDYSTTMLFAIATFDYYSQVAVTDFPANGACFSDIHDSNKIICVLRTN